MKYILLVIGIIFSVHINAQIVNIPDLGFKQFLIDGGIDTNGDGDIQVSEAEIIDSLNINDEMIFSIEGIKSFTNLRVLQLDISNVDQIDISGLGSLESFLHASGFFISINAEGCISLKNLELNGESYEILDFTGCNSLQNFESDFDIFSLKLTNCTDLESINLNTLVLMDLDISGCSSLKKFEGEITGPGSSFNFIGLPLLDTIIIYTTSYSDLNLANLPSLTNLQVENLSRLMLRSCPNLEELNVNTVGIFLDILGLDKLKNVSYNGLGYSDMISIIDCKNLLNLSFHDDLSGVINLDLSGCSALQTVNTDGFFDFERLIMKDCSSLKNLDFYNSNISPYCDFSGMSSLKNINFELGPNEIFLDGCYSLETFNVQSSSPTQYDFSDCINLKEVNLGAIPNLEVLILQNGTTEIVTFNYAISLLNVCVDPEELAQMQEYLSTFDNINAEVTTSCDFADGGKPFSVIGTSYLDVNNDSCKTSTQTLPFSKYVVNTNIGKRYFYTNEEGSYQYNVLEGQYIFGPELLFGDYIFSTFPETRSVDFPADGSSVNQDFCFIPNPEEVDVIEVNLIPLEPARPGFNARYLITYTNTGNVTRGGDIKLTFQDEFMDFLIAEPMESVLEEGFISWSFEDLIPYETRSIEFSMNLNSPMDTPPLNGDDILNFTAEVGPLGNQTLTVYWSHLNQEVVNSFDPNDKTCLNGNAFDQELVGDYLKYMIRFENTGSADAVNIVVIDTLDDTKFDVRTLQVINASHEVETEHTDNVVKFTFRDIYLPFEDATNDGYVTFKIKTLPSLVLGDDIRNKAEIFFDFNFPIVTNTTSTIISDFTSVDELGISTFDLEISPNPAFESVLISSDVQMSKIELFDHLGRLLKGITFVRNKDSFTLPIDHLLTGVYFIKVYSENGHSIKKLIKK